MARSSDPGSNCKDGRPVAGRPPGGAQAVLEADGPADPPRGRARAGARAGRQAPHAVL